MFITLLDQKDKLARGGSIDPKLNSLQGELLRR